MKKVKMYFTECNDVSIAKCDTIYSTTNCGGKNDTGMFKLLQYNRGEDNGIETKRLNDFKKIVKENKFFFTWINVVINESGVIVDGHHRFQLLKELGLPVNFIITAEKKFNPEYDPKGTKLLSAIATLNAVDSKWNGTHHFNAAVKCGVQLAVEIKMQKALFDNKMDIDRKQVTGGRIFNLIKKNVKGLQSTLVDVTDYEDATLIERLVSDDFKKELEFVYGIMSVAKRFNDANKNKKRITGYKIVAAAMPLVWNNELNMDKFLKAVEIYEFNNVADSWSGGKYYVNMIQKELLNLDAGEKDAEIKRKRKELKRVLSN
jgi:hypothetical protein